MNAVIQHHHGEASHADGFLRSRANPISVAVAYREPLVRAGLASTLASDGGFAVSFIDHLQRAPSQNPSPSAEVDVVVADYETALAISSAMSTDGLAGKVPRVMVVSHRDRESEIRHALACGVHGYLLLGCQLDDMIDGVKALHRGQRHLGQAAAQRVVESLSHEVLTAREADVLRLLADGRVNKSIASELHIALGTVKAHVKSILAKLGARTRTEAASVAQRRGLLA
ncbi:MAG: response regulator transcription factor [Caldimonas sp.]